MVRDERSEATKKKVGAKSTSATKDKTKYPVDCTKGETGYDGVRTATTHERSADEAYECCGMYHKIAISLVEEGYTQMSDLQGLKTRKDVASLMKVMRPPSDATYVNAVPAYFERYFYLINLAAMHIERC